MEASTESKTRGEKMYDFIQAAWLRGQTCYLSTALRVTKIAPKHAAQVRVRRGCLEIQRGKRWLDYSLTHLRCE